MVGVVRFLPLLAALLCGCPTVEAEPEAPPALLPDRPRRELVGAAQADWLGASVAGAGDVDGDGYDDLLVGAPGRMAPEAVVPGRVLLFRGSASGPEACPAWSTEGPSDGAHLGWYVAGVGDVHGDGFDDLAVASPWDGQLSEHGGSVQLFDGGPDGPGQEASWSRVGDQAEEMLGNRVAGLGDIDGDGFDDLAIGISLPDRRGRVEVFHGGPDGPGAAADWSTEGEAPEGLAALAARAGDVNGDGYADLVVGSAFVDEPVTDAGRVLAWTGGPEGLSEEPAWRVDGAQDWGYLGGAVGSADLDGDGFSDLLVGQRGWTADGIADAGRVLAFAGGSAGPASEPTWSAEGELAGGWLGAAVASAGDLDGDGDEEVVAGAFFSGDALFEQGLVRVWAGGGRRSADRVFVDRLRRAHRRSPRLGGGVGRGPGRGRPGRAGRRRPGLERAGGGPGAGAGVAGLRGAGRAPGLLVGARVDDRGLPGLRALIGDLPRRPRGRAATPPPVAP